MHIQEVARHLSLFFFLFAIGAKKREWAVNRGVDGRWVDGRGGPRQGALTVAGGHVREAWQRTAGLR